MKRNKTTNKIQKNRKLFITTFLFHLIKRLSTYLVEARLLQPSTFLMLAIKQ